MSRVDAEKCTSTEFLRAFQSILDSTAEESTSVAKRSLERKELDESNVCALHQLIISCDRQSSSTDVVDLCDEFITEWEKSGHISAAVQQLNALLTRPHIRGLLLAVADISAGRFVPRLPDIPFEVDDDDGIAVKIVKIARRDEPLGATIKRDQDGRVTIARVIAGGVADRTACILEGDRVLEVNGVNVAGLEPNEILKLLERTEGGSVTLKLVPTDIPSSSTSDQTHIHLRAVCDYDGRSDPMHPCAEAALSFRKGDILELLVCSDQNWWQARCLGSGGLASGDEERRSQGGVGVLRVGLIPSEAIQQKRRLHGHGGSLRKHSHSDTEDADIFYESVCRLRPRPGLVRPIVLIGAPGVGRNELKRRLMMAFPDKYTTTVPHTTRSPRPHEQSGVDYHFVPRLELEDMIQRGEMVEFGEFRGNLYGTALSSVRKAASLGTPLLTPHPLALRSLRNAEFRPIVIYIQPPDKEEFRETRAAYRHRCSRATSHASGSTTISTLPRAFTDLEIDRIINNGRQLDQTYGHFFDSRLVNGCLETAFSALTRLIYKYETRASWVPLSWASRDTF